MGRTGVAAGCVAAMQVRSAYGSGTVPASKARYTARTMVDIRHRDRPLVPEADLTVTAEAAEVVADLGAGQSYFIVHDSGGIRVFEIAEGQELLVGRAEDSALVVRDPRASRRHALLTRREGRLYVRDQGSHNATL